MNTLYLICVVVGGTLFGLQFLISLLGFGGHEGHIAHGAHGHSVAGGQSETSWLSGMISFRAMVCALVVFGLAGLATTAGGSSPGVSVAISLACALAAMFLVALLTHSMTKLDADGSLDIQNAVGKFGTVYLTVPAARAGPGKVTISLQNRTVEFQALTPGASIPTGAKVVVQAVIGSDTVEVLPHVANPV